MVRTGGPDSKRCHFSLLLRRIRFIQCIHIRKCRQYPFPNYLGSLKSEKSFMGFLTQLGPLGQTSPDHYFWLWTNVLILVSFNRFFRVHKQVLLDQSRKFYSFRAIGYSIIINKQRNWYLSCPDHLSTYSDHSQGVKNIPNCPSNLVFSVHIREKTFWWVVLQQNWYKCHFPS